MQSSHYFSLECLIEFIGDVIRAKSSLWRKVFIYKFNFFMNRLISTVISFSDLHLCRKIFCHEVFVTPPARISTSAGRVVTAPPSLTLVVFLTSPF